MLNLQELGASVRCHTSSPEWNSGVLVWYLALRPLLDPWVKGPSLSSPAAVTLGLGDINHGVCAIRESRELGSWSVNDFELRICLV